MLPRDEAAYPCLVLDTTGCRQLEEAATQLGRNRIRQRCAEALRGTYPRPPHWDPPRQQVVGPLPRLVLPVPPSGAECDLGNECWD
jgi:hypothetical protein